MQLNSLSFRTHRWDELPLTLLVLLAASICLAGCGGTVRRIQGHENILPAAGTIVFRTEEESHSSGQNVTFVPIATEGFRADPALLEYAWDFGQGAMPQTSSAATPTVTLKLANSDGASYPVTLRLSYPGVDDQTYTGHYSVAPAGTWGVGPILAPDSVANGEDAVLSAQLTGQPPAAGQLQYNWTVENAPGDTSQDATTLSSDSAVTPTATFINSGTIARDVIVNLQVTNSLNPGEKYSAPARTIHIQPPSWSISFVIFPAQVASGQSVKLGVALAGTLPPADDLGYFWQFGPGASSGSRTEAEPTITLTNEDTKPAKVCQISVRVYRKSNPDEARPAKDAFHQENISITYSAPAA